MKIESEKVNELIKLFRFYFDGVIETIQIGNHGFQENCIIQKETCIEEILNWKSINMPEKVEKVKNYKDKELEEMTSQERWGINLRSYLIRRIKADDSIGDVHNDNLIYHIENYLLEPRFIREIIKKSTHAK